VKKALATPVPSAAAKPRGRQQLMLASELKIAANEAETPVGCFIGKLLVPLRPPLTRFGYRTTNRFNRGKTDP